MPDDKGVEIKILFSNKKAAQHFASWLCEAGEQDYWLWMESCERREGGNITATSFNYHGPDGNGKFMKDNIIRTSCGRLDKKS